jgi:hypothetical protein
MIEQLFLQKKLGLCTVEILTVLELKGTHSTHIQLSPLECAAHYSVVELRLCAMCSDTYSDIA